MKPLHTFSILAALLVAVAYIPVAVAQTTGTTDERTERREIRPGCAILVRPGAPPAQTQYSGGTCNNGLLNGIVDAENPQSHTKGTLLYEGGRTVQGVYMFRAGAGGPWTVAAVPDTSVTGPSARTFCPGSNARERAAANGPCQTVARTFGSKAFDLEASLSDPAAVRWAGITTASTVAPAKSAMAPASEAPARTSAEAKPQVPNSPSRPAAEVSVPDRILDTKTKATKQEFQACRAAILRSCFAPSQCTDKYQTAPCVRITERCGRHVLGKGEDGDVAVAALSEVTSGGLASWDPGDVIGVDQLDGFRALTWEEVRSRPDAGDTCEPRWEAQAFVELLGTSAEKTALGLFYRQALPSPREPPHRPRRRRRNSTTAPKTSRASNSNHGAGPAAPMKSQRAWAVTRRIYSRGVARGIPRRKPISPARTRCSPTVEAPRQPQRRK